jgi:hypothetical protein
MLSTKHNYGFKRIYLSTGNIIQSRIIFISLCSGPYRFKRNFTVVVFSRSLVLPHNTVSSKKRKLSGLSGLELQLAYNSLLKLKKSIVYEESEEEEGPPEGFEQQIDTMLSLLGPKLEGPQV